jgi:hypothetical protein
LEGAPPVRHFYLTTSFEALVSTPFALGRGKKNLPWLAGGTILAPRLRDQPRTGVGNRRPPMLA